MTGMIEFVLGSINQLAQKKADQFTILRDLELEPAQWNWLCMRLRGVIQKQTLLSFVERYDGATIEDLADYIEALRK